MTHDWGGTYDGHRALDTEPSIGPEYSIAIECYLDAPRASDIYLSLMKHGDEVFGAIGLLDAMALRDRLDELIEAAQKNEADRMERP